jgi:glycosyltransferase involved in cell wall biosynthesis
MPDRRIAFLSEHASPLALLGSEDAGGQNVYVHEVSRNLAALGYAVDIFTRRDSPSLAETIEWGPGVRVVHVTAGPTCFILKDEIWPYMREFRDNVRRFMERTGARYDLIHGNFWMSGWAAVELSRSLSLPVVQIFHAMGKTKRRHQAEADTSPPQRIAVEVEVVRSADRLIAQCPSEAAELVDDYGAEPGRVVTIPSAVNAEVFRPVPQAEARERIGFPRNDPLVVYVGRMLPRKDPRNIVRAVALLTGRGVPTRLLVVGGESAEPDRTATPEIGALQDLAAALGIADRVHFTGKRQADVLRYYYSAGDVAVTTPWYEPFGLTPLECMACGRPVVGSAVGGITSTVVDGKTGLLIPPRDPTALADALQRLLLHPEMRERMGRQARARVEAEYTWPLVARRTAALYETLLEPAPALAVSAATHEGGSPWP